LKLQYVNVSSGNEKRDKNKNKIKEGAKIPKIYGTHQGDPFIQK
jgi:hypothetical protein